jgi:hypothetical protein
LTIFNMFRKYTKTMKTLFRKAYEDITQMDVAEPQSDDDDYDDDDDYALPPVVELPPTAPTLSPNRPRGTMGPDAPRRRRIIDDQLWEISSRLRKSLTDCLQAHGMDLQALKEMAQAHGMDLQALKEMVQMDDAEPQCPQAPAAPALLEEEEQQFALAQSDGDDDDDDYALPPVVELPPTAPTRRRSPRLAMLQSEDALHEAV